MPPRRRSGLDLLPLRVRAATLAAAAVLLFVACDADRAGGAESDEEPRYGGTVVIAGTRDLQVANPLVVREANTSEVYRYLLFMPLLRYDEELRFTPYLARSWSMEGDTAAVFELRGDVRWHDGVATTAHDVAFTFERALDPVTAFPNASLFGEWTGVEVLDSLRVRVRFRPGLEPLRGVPQLPIVPRHLLEQVAPADLTTAAFNRSPVGNGPFRFLSGTPNDRWVFGANPDFPAELGGRPYVDRLIWRVVPDATAQVAELRSGRVDVLINPGAERFGTLDSLPGLRGLERVSGQYNFIGWNGLRPPFGDARVRRALSMGIDREQMLNLLRGGYGELAVGPVLPGHWAFHHELEPLPHDPDAARSLLAEAGIRDTDADPWLELPTGEDFGFELKIPAGSEANRAIAQIIESDLRELGVRVGIRPVDQAVFFQDFASPGRNFDAVIVGFQASLDLNLRDPYHSEARGGIFQLASYANPEVDSLLDAMAAARTREEAIPPLRRLQEVLRDEQPWTYLYYYPDLYIIRERLRGVRMDLRGALVNAPEWWLADAGDAGVEGGGATEREGAGGGGGADTAGGR